jgi:translation elongation factor EF-1alpha
MQIINSNNKPEMKIEDVTATLKANGHTVPENATEAQVLEMLKTATAKAGASTPDNTEVETLKAENDRLKQAQADMLTANIENAVESAIEQGRILAKQKDTYISLLKNDFTNGSKVLNDMPARKSVASATAANATSDSRADWTFDKYSKEDPNGLLKMKNSEPDKYQMLLDAELKSI